MAGGATEVLLPNLGLEVEDGEIVEWMVRVGDRVEKGQPLASIATDKAESELESEQDGYVVAILHAAGARVAVGTPIAMIGSTPDAAVATAPEAAPAGEPQRVAPVARRLAAEHGIELGAVAGTGPRGRITVEDVRALASANGHAAEPPVSAPPAPLPRLRRITAERMAASQQVPQFDVFREVETAAVRVFVARLRERDGATAARIGVNDVLVRAYAVTLREHPRLNAAIAEVDGRPALAAHHAVHVGLAVATGDGLVVPVIRDAATGALSRLAAERLRLVAAARDGVLEPGELRGSTTTLSSLARYAIDGFTGMLNPPQAAILAVGPPRPRALVKDGALVAGETMRLTLTVDHRAVDGAESAAALAALGDLLESDAALAQLEETT